MIPVSNTRFCHFLHLEYCRAILETEKKMEEKEASTYSELVFFSCIIPKGAVE